MMCRMLRDDFGGEIPDTIEQLVKLPGVGRKTANLIVGDLYGKPALVCDTHVIRVSGRLGLTDGTKDALKVEKQLAAIIKPDDRLMMCHRLVWHGRLVCSAAKPNCSECRLSGFASSFRGQNKITAWSEYYERKGTQRNNNCRRRAYPYRNAHCCFILL